MALTRQLTFSQKLHRRIGVALALFVCLIAITGIALNHSDDIGLDKNYVPGWIARLYLGSNEVLGIQSSDQFFYSLGGNLFVDRTAISPCNRLQDWASLDDQEVALCDEELILLTPGFELIERVDGALGLPANITEIHSTGTEFLVLADSRWLSLDLMSLQPSPSPFDGQTSVVDWVSVPTEYLLGESVTWQQFILDVHSGVVIGLPGKLFTDLIGILLVLMVLSGLWMWHKTR